MPNQQTIPPNLENRPPVNQNKNDVARLQRVSQFIQENRKIFARQGTVAATWRTYKGRRLGPYYQLAYRDQDRQHWIYLGRSEELAQQVRDLLENLHRPRNQKRLYRRLEAQARHSLQLAKAQLKEVCREWGITLKGYEFRGARKALIRYAQSHPPAPS